MLFLIVDTRNINQIFTENSYFQKGTVPSIADYLCKVPFDATVEREWERDIKTIVTQSAGKWLVIIRAW